jgi:hypothetical protein
MHEVLEARWTLVVKVLKNGAEAAQGKFCVQFGAGSNKFMLTAGFEWLG